MRRLGALLMAGALAACSSSSLGGGGGSPPAKTYIILPNGQEVPAQSQSAEPAQ